MLKQTLAAGSLLVGGLATISPAAAFNQHGFELHVARTESLSDLNFYWHVKPLFNYDVFNVRVRTSAGGEKQFEIGPFRGEKCTHRDGVFFFMVQGCDKGTFHSKCTPWSDIAFKNVRGINVLDGP